MISITKLNDWEQIIYYTEDIEKMIDYLNEIVYEKSTIKKLDDNYLHLCYLESVARYKISKSEFSNIVETFEHLKKALNCVKQIQIYYSLKNDKKNEANLNALHQEAIILYELSIINDDLNLLEKSFQILTYLRENISESSKLYYLTLMNETNFRLELATKEINIKENCIKVLKLCEDSRNNFPIYSKEYNATFLNQSNALSLLIKNEDFGIGIEFYEIMKKLVDKYDNHEFLNIYLDLELIELGYKKFDKLNDLLKIVDTLLNGKLSFNYQKYHECVILKGNILLKKAQLCNNKNKKIEYLNNCVFHFENYLQKDILDKFYKTKAIYKTAYAKYELSKLNIRKKQHLTESISLLSESKEFYEKTPYQNKKLLYPLVLLYLAKSNKELNRIDNLLDNEKNNIERSFQEVINYFKENNNKEKIIECYLELGDLFFITKDYKKAYHYLNKGINLVELMKSSIINLEIKKKFNEKINNLFKLIIETCFQLGKIEETLKYVELSKHRIFLDKIIEKQKYYFIKPLPKELFHELGNITSKIELILSKIKNCDNNGFKISSNYEKLSNLKKQEEYYLYKIKTEYPEYYDYYYNQVFDYKKLNLKNKTFIEYYYTNEFLLIFLIENEKFIVKRVDFKEYNLKKLIKDFKAQLIEYEDVEKTENILNKLFNILIEPIHEDISNDNLIIIPYKGLHNIPFNCLKSNEDYYLIDKFTITIAQSGSSLKYIENNYDGSSNEEHLVIGDPTDDLPYAEKEAIEISKLFKTKPLLKEEATKENILKNLEGKNIIHFAGHGRFDTQNPINSSLKLNKGERLYINDLNNLELNSELIVLSACETGIVSVDDNDETEGFVKYLQIDGSKYIIASLWEGIDDAAYELFKIFYSTNENYSKRLQLAQLELKKNHDLFYWGNFQIYGI